MSMIPLLTDSSASEEAYRLMMDKTIQAVLDGYKSGKAFSGISPSDLKKTIETEILPSHGKGYDAVLDELRTQVIPHFVHPSSASYMAHLHSPALLESLAAEVVLSAFNQSMDSWDQAPVATEIELATVRMLCDLYGYGEAADGTFTSGGSQSNLSAIFFARDWFCNEVLHHDVKKKGLPSCFADLRLYTSEISHFSMEKSAHLLGLGYDAVRKVPVDSKMKMDTKALEAMIREDEKAGKRPFCVVATIGTTDYGSIDSVEQIHAICEKHGLWLHADAAYGSAAILSDTYRPRIGDLSLCDSITVDFHKMFLLPISCSAVLVKEGKDMSPCMLHADYLNREEDEEDGYTNLVGKSLQTTRRFDALKVWVAFQCRGRDGYGEIIDTCVGNAHYVYQALLADPAFIVAVEPELSSVVFRLTGGDELNKHVRRHLLESGIIIGQTVHQGNVCLKFTLLNPTITHEQLDELLRTIKRSAQ